MQSYKFKLPKNYLNLKWGDLITYQSDNDQELFLQTDKTTEVFRFSNLTVEYYNDSTLEQTVSLPPLLKRPKNFDDGKRYKVLPEQYKLPDNNIGWNYLLISYQEDKLVIQHKDGIYFYIDKEKFYIKENEGMETLYSSYIKINTV